MNEAVLAAFIEHKIRGAYIQAALAAFIQATIIEREKNNLCTGAHAVEAFRFLMVI